MEKPKISIITKVPTRDSGMATMGMATERGEPRKAKITQITMASASARLLITSVIDCETKMLVS